MTVSHGMSERLLDLDDGERRHHADEGEEQDEEPGERPDDDRAVGDRRVIRPPRVRVEVVPEAGDDDVEALEPHPDEDEDRHHVQDGGVEPGPPREEDERDQAIARVHAPVGPRVLLRRLGEHARPLEVIPAVPRREHLAHVEVREHQARHEDQLGHGVQMLVVDVRVPVEDVAHREDEDQDHGKTGEDGPVDEEGREERGVPARHERHREVERHDAVHGQDERRRDRGEDAVGAAVVAPLRVRPLPAQRHDGVDLLLDPRRLIPQRRDVRHEADEEEHHADGEVRGDGEHVPHQRRLEVRPEIALVRVRHEPVGEPHPPRVDEGEQPGGHDREHRHGLGPPVDRGPPFRPEEVEHRRDERARVSDADPEHEGRDVHRPHLRRALARRAHPDPDLPGPGRDPRGEGQADQAHPGEVPVARHADRPDDVAVDVGPGRIRGGRGGARRAHALCPLSGPVSTWRTTFLR